MADNKKNLPKIIDINEWVNDYSAFMAEEAVKLLTAQGMKKGPEVFRALAIGFLARVTTNVIYTALNDRSPDAKSFDEQAHHNMKVFGEMKQNVAEAMASAFTVAMTHYTNKNMEYYCIIKPVPDAPSNAVN